MLLSVFQRIVCCDRIAMACCSAKRAIIAFVLDLTCDPCLQKGLLMSVVACTDFSEQHLPATLAEAAVLVLTTSSPADKCALTQQIASAWAAGEIAEVGCCPPPDRPARPQQPQLLPPKDMPKRSTGPGKGRPALIHALCHIELNAVDLAWDIVARFTDQDLPRAFYDDWVQVAVDEALHYQMLEQMLIGLGEHYGAFPAHDGLWQAAEQTAHSLSARLAIVPCTHEARGLDTTPPTLARLQAQGEQAMADALQIIYRDEITHVAAGVRWLTLVAERQGVDPAALFATELGRHYKGGLKPPFNDAARAEAGMTPAWYMPVARMDESMAG